MNLFDAIFREISSSATAVLYEQRRITYGLLQEQTLRMAQVLRGLDLASGDRVAILLPDSPEFIASFISICSSGAIAVPINMALRAEEQEAILRDCTAKVAIVEASHCSSLLTDAPETLRHLREIIVVCLSEKDKLEFSTWQAKRAFGELVRIRLMADQQSESNDIASKFPSADEAFADPASGQASRQDSGQDRPAFILYTSGSTGEPKGAIHSQADIFYTNGAFCREVLQLSSADRLFSSSRLPFAYGLGNSLAFPLLNGATTILCREKPTVEIIARVFRESRPTIFFAVPVVYNLLLDQQRRSFELDCSSLRLCISAGEALPATLGAEWEKTFGVPVLDGIGSTEMMHMFMSNQAGSLRYGSSGKLLKGYEAQLRDDQDRLSPSATEGHLWVKGESAAQGYWQRPQQTARTFVEGWVRTGDLYRCDSDGYWFHMGRSDDCFKSSGQWVSPVEVEGVLLHDRQIRRAAIVEDFDEAGLPCACAFVVCKDVESDFERVEQDLRQLATESLPRFKRPRKYVFVKELPSTVTGKIQRFKLREQLRNVQSPTSSVQSLPGQE
jgi:benzoate-CoA ligase family protein